MVYRWVMMISVYRRDWSVYRRCSPRCVPGREDRPGASCLGGRVWTGLSVLSSSLLPQQHSLLSENCNHSHYTLSIKEHWKHHDDLSYSFTSHTSHLIPYTPHFSLHTFLGFVGSTFTRSLAFPVLNLSRNSFLRLHTSLCL